MLTTTLLAETANDDNDDDKDIRTNNNINNNIHTIIKILPNKIPRMIINDDDDVDDGRNKVILGVAAMRYGGGRTR